MGKKSTDYKNQYNKENYSRIEVYFPKKDKEAIHIRKIGMWTFGMQIIQMLKIGMWAFRMLFIHMRKIGMWQKTMQ